MTRLRSGATTALARGGTISVDSRSSTMAGPSSVAPGSSP